MGLLKKDIVPNKQVLIEAVALPLLGLKRISMHVLRLDKIHPIASGNKLFKLHYHLLEALKQGKESVVTLGGPFSNHIIATAFAAKQVGLKTMGIVRGHTPSVLSTTLQNAVALGMQLHFVDKPTYQQIKETQHCSIMANAYFINEGGAGPLGEKGATEILSGIENIEQYTHIACAIGTGTMVKGIYSTSLPHQTVIGVPVLKGFDDWLSNSHLELDKEKKINILSQYHFGGYAKKTDALLQCMNSFYHQTQIPTDFVYTGKLLFALLDSIASNYFLPGSNLLMIHSGGLQGNASLPPTALNF
jgi:1-aminocyclopropane-1-carboxylate deaminase